MLRVSYSLKNTTHSPLILCLSNSLPVNALIYMRFIKFFANMINNKNALVSFFSKCALYTSDTITGNNLSHIIKSFNLRIPHNSNRISTSCVNNLRQRIASHFAHPRTVTDLTCVLSELTDCLEGVGEIPGFTHEEYL